MSETNGAAAPATPAPAPSDAGMVDAPAPNSRPELNLTEAARLLRRARNQGEQRSETVQNRNGVSRETPAAAPASAAAPETPSAESREGRTPTPKGVEAMERALGVPHGEPEQTGDDSAAPPAPEGPQRERIEVDGRSYDMTELRALVAAGQDYTRKTQQLAEQMRQLEGQQQALAQFLPHIQPEIGRLQQQLQDAPRPDPALRQTDPASYWEQFARWQDAMAEQQRFAQINALQQQARDAAMQQQVDEGNAVLAQKYPFWADPAQRAEIQQEVVRWALDKGGYTKDELRGLTNPRYLETMMKAAFFDKWAAGSRTQAPTSRTQPRSPMGTPPPPAPVQSVQQAMDAFDKRPSIRSGAQLLAARRSSTGNGHTRW